MMQEGANQKCLPLTILYKEAYIILESLKPSNFLKVLKTEVLLDALISHLDIQMQSQIFYHCKGIASLLSGN